VKSAAVFVCGLLLGGVLTFAVFHAGRFQMQVLALQNSPTPYQAFILDTRTGRYYVHTIAGGGWFDPLSGKSGKVEGRPE